MLFPRPFSTNPGFRLSRVAIRVELSRHSTFDHDDDVVVNPYASERLNEPIQLVQYLFLSSSPSLSFQLHKGSPLVILGDFLSCPLQQLSRHCVRRIDVNRACAAVFETEPAIIAR